MFKFRPLLESLESRETPSPIGNEVDPNGGPQEVQNGDAVIQPTTDPTQPQVPTH